MSHLSVSWRWQGLVRVAEIGLVSINGVAGLLHFLDQLDFRDHLIEVLRRELVVEEGSLGLLGELSVSFE